MKLEKEQLLAINSLSLSGILDEMDNSRFDNYCKELFAFTESFPAREAELKGLFNVRDFDTFAAVLAGVGDMLEGIYARGAAQSALKLLEELKTQTNQIVEAHLICFLSEISQLSIDIQMARQKFKPAGEAEVLPEKRAEVCLGDDRPRSILAVDDVAFTLSSLKLALKDTRYKLIAVKSGAEALRFIKGNTPDLFILDIEMPEMDGYELAREIRNGGQRAPIIFLTGNSNEEYVVKAIEAGAADFIVKPVNDDQVLNKIRKHIG